MSKLDKFLQRKQALENKIEYFDAILDKTNYFSIKSGNVADWSFMRGQPLYEDIQNLMYIERHKLRGELLDIKCTIVEIDKLL